jgi:3',5'-cyclic-AMP phosphodiesterase
MAEESAAQADFSFVHFTDTHVIANATLRPPHGSYELDTAATLQRVLDVIAAMQPQPAFAVIGGDLATPDLLDFTRKWTPEEYEPSYRLLQKQLQTLTCPTYMLMGNHDNRIAFRRVMQPGRAASDEGHYYSFDHQGYHFIALDSLQPGEASGHLEAEQLDWLRDDLEAHRGEPTLVFVHHHPWDIGLKWLDAMKLRNGDDLVGVLQGFPQVRWMICGHIHLDHVSQRGGLTMMSTPSTCFQISKWSQTRKFVAAPPAFRLVQIQGLEISTRVLHLNDDGLDSL